MASSIEVPRTANGITSEWLSNVFKETKTISQDSSLVITTKKPLTGGFNSSVFHLQVEHNPPNPTLPNSFVVKYVVTRGPDKSTDKEASILRNATTIGEVLKYSPQEVKFRLPIVYHINKTGQRHIFILEDLTRFSSVPQGVGANLEEAQLIVKALAVFHAKFWSTEADSHSALRDKWCPLAEGAATWETYQKYMLGSVEDGFYELIEDEQIRKIAKLASEHLAQLVAKAQKGPCTLLHGDARVSNYFIDKAQSEVIAVDWQGFEVGNGPGELAYFLSMSVQQTVMETHEADLYKLYYDTLQENGVKELKFENFVEMYKIGLATSASVPVLTARGVLEGRKHIAKPPSNPALAQVAQTSINMYNGILIHPLSPANTLTSPSHRGASNKTAPHEME